MTWIIFASTVFQISQHPDLFEHLPIEVLRFIHNQRRGQILIGALQQQIVQGKQHFGLGRAVALQVEIPRHHFEELLGRQARIENEPEGGMVRREVVAQALQQGGFACAHLAGEHNEALTAGDAVNKVGQRLFVKTDSGKGTKGRGSD